MSRLNTLAARLQLPPVMLAFALVALAMTLLSIAYTLTTTYILKLPYPYGAPLFFLDDRWFDFAIYSTRFQHFRTPSFWDDYGYPFTYPAPVAIIYGLVYKIPHAVRYHLIAYAAETVAAALIFRRHLVARGIGGIAAIAFTFIFFVFNYPIRTLFESANTEGMVAIIAAFGLYHLLRDRCYLGGALIAIAGTMKIFPFILLALLLSKRRYREFAFAIAVAVAVNYASLAIVGPTIAEAQRHVAEGIQFVRYTFIYSTSPAAVTFNHSLFTFVKFPVSLIYWHFHPYVIDAHTDWVGINVTERHNQNIAFLIYVTVAGAFGFFAYFRWIRQLPMLNQLLALTVCALILPPLSADYTLLHTLFPFSVLCLYAADRWRKNIEVAGLKACFLCFPAIFCFQTYLTWGERFSCEFRTAAMVVLLVLVIRHRFPWDELDAPNPETLQCPGAPFIAASSR